MPLASMVIILLMLRPSKILLNSSAICIISVGSIWWLMKLSTFSIPPGKHLPSCIIRSFSMSISFLS